MKFYPRRRLIAALGAVVSVLSLALASPALSAPRTPRGVITYAEAPGAAPNWIFPFTGFQNYSASNINQFQQLMFRPLYFFGLGASVAFVPSLSLANPPVMSNRNKTITINLKGWRFADGQVVDAQSVMFFLNLYAADPTSYGGYTPGVGIPDQVASARGSGDTVVIQMKTPVNSSWILYNYLSEITPLPNSWDLTGPRTHGRCATGAYGASDTGLSCKQVEVYLDKLSSTTSTFTSNFWQSGVDGPWKLTSFDSLGNATFQPNPHYSGPQKAQVDVVKELAYSSEGAEEADLQAGKVDLGYLDTSSLKSAAPSPGKVGANLASLDKRYRLSITSPYAFNYAQVNFSSSNPLQAEFDQLYIRQALQRSIDQASIIKNIDQNYGVIGYSPLPPNTPTSISATPVNPYPYDPVAAKALLTSHGWSEVNNVMTCESPGTAPKECGANIAQGATLSFTFTYVTGDPTINDTVNAIVGDWATIGVTATASANTFTNLVAACSLNSGTQWSICWSGDGWTYAPNYYPSGEENFFTHAQANWGGYSDPTMNRLIREDTVGDAPLGPFEQYAADQLPVLFLPNSVNTFETIRSLKSSIGWASNGLQNFLPEYLHF